MISQFTLNTSFWRHFAIPPQLGPFRHRLDCLLMVMQLELSRQADDLVNAQLISDWLSVNQVPGRRPGTVPLFRRSIADSHGPSLPSPQSISARRQNRLTHRQGLQQGF